MHFTKRIGLLTLFFFFFAPMLTFIHEIGHSIIPLLNGESVAITIGGSSKVLSNTGQFSFVYASPWQPWAGFAKWSGDREILRLALGPLTSLMMAALFFILLKRSYSPAINLLLKLSFCWVLGAFVVTAFPFRYPSFILQNPTDASDGMQIREILESGK